MPARTCKREEASGAALSLVTNWSRSLRHRLRLVVYRCAWFEYIKSGLDLTQVRVSDIYVDTAPHTRNSTAPSGLRAYMIYSVGFGCVLFKQ